MKNSLATIVGFIAASLTVYIFEALIGHQLFPFPEGANPMDMEWIKNNMNRIPTGAKVMVVIGHFMGIMAGMFIAGLISKTSLVPAYIVGGLMLAATVFNIIMLPKALWFSSSDIVLAVAGLWIGKSLAQRQLKI
ncbi:hypothetical protein ES692_10875 [Psychroserpens burtonensis]|uniref:DUF1761 domain-containing protein n=1 Tax=Psychroserpens burtonensis TaxID=49278 RepID=A0A5C7B5W3_9FLAO|nr:hypothetical protein [Psychroserpens burtonensis]TXE17151.1 hypothetical protein ES692_10875 [Psychroserpens burtonensis]